MSLILRQIIGYSQGRRVASVGADPALKTELNQTKKDLQLILNKWKFGDQPIRTSEEFLAQFEPWINLQIEQKKDLKVFLAKKGVSSLEEADTKLTNRELGEGEELETLRQELAKAQEKHQQELAQQKQTFLNTEADYLQQIQELKTNRELPEDYEDLISERDEAIREKKTLEQQNLAQSNQLKNKQQEINNKEKSLEKLQKEVQQKELNHQKQLREKNGLITTLNREVRDLKIKVANLEKR